jgi:hypothetical protein
VRSGSALWLAFAIDMAPEYVATTSVASRLGSIWCIKPLAASASNFSSMAVRQD